VNTRKWGSIFWLSAKLVFWCLNHLKCDFLLTFAEFFIIPRPRMTLPPSWFLHFLQQVPSNVHTCTEEIRSSLETEITVVHCRGLAEYTTYPHTKRFYITRAFVCKTSRYSSADRANILKILIMQFSQATYYFLPLTSV